VYRRLTASSSAQLRHAKVAVAVGLALAWCGPGLASTGFSISCDEDDTVASETKMSPVPVPSLAAHTDSALQEILDEETVKISALAESTSDTAIDDVDVAETAETTSIRGASESPVINTRLPGVSESSLPSFRRQMYRTDI